MTPSHLWTQTGINLQVENRSGGQISVGCVLGVGIRYFDAVVGPVVLFGSGHRAFHQKDPHQCRLSQFFRIFLCAVVGPPTITLTGDARGMTVFIIGMVESRQ